MTKLYVIAGFVTCSYFVRVFSRRRSTQNLQWYVTVGAWIIFGYEVLRLQFPDLLTIAQPYRMAQHRIEHAWIAIYGWEAIQYVCQKLTHKLAVHDY